MCRIIIIAVKNITGTEYTRQVKGMGTCFKFLLGKTAYLVLYGHGFQYALNSLFTLADISFYISAPAVVNAVSVKYIIEQIIIHSINRQSR